MPLYAISLPLPGIHKIPPTYSQRRILISKSDERLMSVRAYDTSRQKGSVLKIEKEFQAYFVFRAVVGKYLFPKIKEDIAPPG